MIILLNAQKSANISPFSFILPHLRGQQVSATPHDRRPVQNYATCPGAPATDVASIGAARCLLFRPASSVHTTLIQTDRVYKHAER